ASRVRWPDPAGRQGGARIHRARRNREGGRHGASDRAVGARHAAASRNGRGIHRGPHPRVPRRHGRRPGGRDVRHHPAAFLRLLGNPPRMTRVTAFRWVGALGMVVTLASAYAATTGSRRFAERRYAERTAASAAAYLTVGTATTRTGAPTLDPAGFLRRVRALVSLPDWSRDVEVYLGTAPLVRATDPPLSLSTIATVSARSAPQWISGAALAPIPGPVAGRLVGVVRVRPHLPD